MILFCNKKERKGEIDEYRVRADLRCDVFVWLLRSFSFDMEKPFNKTRRGFDLCVDGFLALVGCAQNNNVNEQFRVLLG